MEWKSLTLYKKQWNSLEQLVETVFTNTKLLIHLDLMHVATVNSSENNVFLEEFAENLPLPECNLSYFDIKSYYSQVIIIESKFSFYYPIIIKVMC